MRYLKTHENFYRDFKSLKENFEKEEIEKEEVVNIEECDEDCEDCEDCKDESEKLDEGAFRKFFTGHDSKEDRDDAMVNFHKALDEAEELVSKNPEKFVFDRESLEDKAKENNYKGGIRMQKGGRDKSRVYIVYDNGISGFQQLAIGAAGERKNILGA